jgi:MYXO-CTERM domain-containing protein
MRFIRCATIVLMLAGTATLAATPAFASGPVIDVTPSIAAPGTSVTFAITCGSSASSATLFGTTLGLSEQIPMQPSTHAGEFVTTVGLPTSISPGTYTPAIDCSNGVSGLATLVVHAVPGGAPVTGDGTTSTATGGRFPAAGIGLLALGVLVVAIAIRRRRSRSGA